MAETKNTKTAADAQEQALLGTEEIKEALMLVWHKMALVQQNLAGKMPYPDSCAKILYEISDSLRYCCEDLDTVSNHITALGAFAGGHLKAMTSKRGRVVTMGCEGIAGEQAEAVVEARGVNHAE